MPQDGPLSSSQLLADPARNHSQREIKHTDQRGQGFRHIRVTAGRYATGHCRCGVVLDLKKLSQELTQSSVAAGGRNGQAVRRWAHMLWSQCTSATCLLTLQCITCALLGDCWESEGHTPGAGAEGDRDCTYQGFSVQRRESHMAPTCSRRPFSSAPARNRMLPLLSHRQSADRHIVCVKDEQRVSPRARQQSTRKA